MRILWAAIRAFGPNHGIFLAAGLSFYLLMCLIPLVLVVASIAGFVLTSQAAAAALLDRLAELVPVYRRELREVLSDIIEGRRITGMLGIAVLAVFSTQLFAALRLVLNRIFAVERARSFVRGTLHDLLMIVLCGTLFLGSIAVSDLLGWLKLFVLGPAEMPPRWTESALIALALGVNTALFSVAYRYVPNRRVPVGPAVAGGLLTSVLWEVAKRVFRWYILAFGAYDIVFGPLSVLIALSMFAYYSAVVFILGAEFAAALERHHRAAA